VIIGLILITGSIGFLQQSGALDHVEYTNYDLITHLEVIALFLSNF
jgi:hypothetical protein